jgi:hypothetical protein
MPVELRREGLCQSVPTDGLREKEGEKKQRVGEGPGGRRAVKDEENERHNAWTARY